VRDGPRYGTTEGRLNQHVIHDFNMAHLHADTRACVPATLAPWPSPRARCRLATFPSRATVSEAGPPRGPVHHVRMCMSECMPANVACMECWAYCEESGRVLLLGVFATRSTCCSRKLGVTWMTCCRRCINGMPLVVRHFAGVLMHVCLEFPRA
jgi:hypothetical protein